MRGRGGRSDRGDGFSHDRMRDDILDMHRSRRDGRHSTSGADFAEERHKKFLNMNRRRADRFKTQVINATNVLFNVSNVRISRPI